jgi:hypothetical protein
MQEITKERQRKEQQAREKFLRTAKTDPRLTTTVEIKAQIDVPDPQQPGRTMKRFCDLADTLRQIADQTRLSIIGDYDPCWDDYYSRLDAHDPDLRTKQIVRADLPAMPAWQALEYTRSHFEVEWEKIGEVIQVRSERIDYALMDHIDVLDPKPLPSYWQRLMQTYKPGDRLPGVTYDR